MKEYSKPVSEFIEYDKCEDILTASTQGNTNDLYSEDEYEYNQN
jgi:hypothetical protein